MTPFESAPDVALFLVRGILGAFFVLARFRWFYDPSRPEHWFNCGRHDHLAWKLCTCGYGRNVYLVTASNKRQPESVSMRDGQTAVMPLPSVKKVYNEGVSVRVLARVAFVTVTIIDATGNPAHPEEQFEINPFEGIWRF